MQSEDNYWQRATRVNRRRVLAGSLAASTGIAAIGLVGCGGDDTKPATGASPAATGSTAAGTSPVAEQPKRGGTLRASMTQNLNDVMDPHTSLSQAAQFYTLIGNTAMRPNGDATKLLPELVEKYEIPGDGTTINLTLRQGVTWHNKPPTNGRAFVADDLAFSLTRITGKLNPDKQAAFQRASTLPNFASATAIDEKTVQVKLNKPHSGFLYGMSDWRNTIIPRDFVEKGGDFTKPETLLGTGPWIIDSFANQQKAVFKPNPKWWEQGRPYVDSHEWIFYGDTLSAQTGFAKGEVDWSTGGSKVLNDTVSKLVAKVRQENWVFGNWNHIRFNTAKKPFDDPRVRLAFFRIWDYKTWNDSYYGSDLWDWTGPLAAAFPEAIPSADIAKMAGYNPSTKKDEIKNALQMLSAAGYPDGKGLTFKILGYTPTGIQTESATRAVDDLKSNLKSVQVDLEIPADITVFSRRQAGGDFDIISYTLFPAPDGVIEMTNNVYSTGARNYGKFKDSEVDGLIDKAVTQLDAKARADTMKQLQTALIEKHMPTVHYSMPRQVVFFNPKVKGMQGYGGKLGGGGYDTLLATRNGWIGA